MLVRIMFPIQATVQGKIDESPLPMMPVRQRGECRQQNTTRRSVAFQEGSKRLVHLVSQQK